MASRDENRARKAIGALKEETGREPIFLKLNLADMHSVREAAESFLSCVLCAFLGCRFAR